MSRAAHPARSLEFLSRLHDGELSAAEKAHFESHRAHCDECRKAAADFEATLGYFRTTGTSPAASDLSARVLRRLQTANRRRPALGVAFGIDLRWAGAFTAALVAVILGASLVERQRSARSIPVSFVTPPPNAAAGAQANKDALAVSAEARAREKAGAASVSGDLAGAPQAAAVPSPRPAAPSAFLADKTVSVAAEAPLRAPSAKPSRTRDAGGEPGGAAGRSRRARAETDLEARQSASGSSAEAGKALRLTVTAIDGGTAPAILNGAQIVLSEVDRGRYVITVGADGVPLDVARESPPATAKMIAAAPAPTDGALRTLKALRFAPGDRARRIIALVQ